jgi:signal transduction histidine kinase
LITAIAAALAEMVERRDAESKVIQASKLASIGELAAGVGHEINNPLNGIINCADILIQVLADRPKDRQFAELIRSESERIARIVQNLLTFSRQDRESHSPARLLDIVDAVLSLSRKKIAKSHVRLNVEVSEDLPRVKCRSEQMQQVLMNLIINALHALDEKYPGVDADKVLHITAKQQQVDALPWLRLTVEDHGCGIAPIHMDRLFDPFFTTKSREVGTGLGLSVSDGIVKDHGGRITVESEFGKFARFHVELPLDNGWVSTPAVTD